MRPPLPTWRHGALQARHSRIFSFVVVSMPLSQCLLAGYYASSSYRAMVVLAVTLHCSSCLFFFLRVQRETSVKQKRTCDAIRSTGL
ncbi:hypothetical protein J3E69DRAFT_327391 [Trichoderma sp. SZMC 28015]